MALSTDRREFVLNVLDTRHVMVRRDAFNRLQLTLADGTCLNDVRAVRAFPLTSSQSCVIVQDNTGAEIGLIEDLHTLDRASRKALEAALTEAYFPTKITAVLAVRAKHGFTSWVFDTDRGRCTVYVRDRSDIRWFAAGRLMFTDVNGMKYEIARVDDLDERSQGILDAET
jgi:hypothetical protein